MSQVLTLHYGHCLSVVTGFQLLPTIIDCLHGGIILWSLITCL